MSIEKEAWIKENNACFASADFPCASSIGQSSVDEGVSLGLINIHKIPTGSSGRPVISLTTKGRLLVRKINKIGERK